jgi:hypothetical protein
MIRKHALALAAGLGISILLTTAAAASPDPQTPGDGTVQLEDNPESPVLRIRRQRPNGPNQPPPSAGFRTIDGTDNNRNDTQMGAAGTPLLRLVAAAYGDGISALAGDDRPGAREISNVVAAQSESIPNRRRVTDYLWQWGQFVDHDIDLTDGVAPAEAAAIQIPAGDPWFDPDGTGTVTMSFNRSIYDPDSGTDADNPRQQLDEITAWIDASNVYGSDSERAAALRTLDGTGRLAVSDGNLLPFNVDGFPNAGGPSASLFLAGDVRANEQVGLTAMHTLFVREHNRLAAQIAGQNPQLNGDQVYQRARQIVGALIQKITYDEFLPALLGPRALRPYNGYHPTVDASIANLFSTAAYRFGHSALSPTILRVNRQGHEIAAGHLPLQSAFFAPQKIIDEGGIAPILRGLARQACQAVDPFVVDDLRNFLFGPPGAGGFDLVSLNIQRGRDHGLPSYNETRRALGLDAAADFADISSNPQIQQRLAAAYDDVEQVDLWVGGLAEDPLPRALVGELVFVIVRDQFEALRDGDRLWYQRVLPPQVLREVESTKLADVIRRNTGIRGEIQDDVFHLPRPN